MTEQEGREEETYRRFRAGARKPVRLSPETLVRTRPLREGATAPPLVVEPNAEHVVLEEWARDRREWLEGELCRHGALLFRGFGVADVARFEQVARAVSGELIEYGERSSPRSRLRAGVYTSTDHPADQPILLHNEQSYTLDWPMKLWFCCLRPAARGGRTPLADSRRVLARVPPRTAEAFASRQVTYVRNYNGGLGLTWQETFQTDERAAVEAHCRAAAIEFEWRGGDRLRTRQVRPAIRTHPRTGEQVWFNHALFFHVSSLGESERRSMLALVGEEELPYNTYYGDGSPIEPGVLAELRRAYDQEAVAFDWQAGDVLLVDNMLTSHGREPFEGGRSVVVAMSEPSGTPRS